MTARQAVELCQLLRPQTVIPIHYEGWKHFREGRSEVEKTFSAVQADAPWHVRWLPLGEPVEIAV